MSKRVNKRYSQEFKDKAVKMVIDSEKSTSQIAQDLGIKVTTLYSWVNNEKSNSTPDAINNEHLFDELKKLKKELAQVKEQRDILKKATAYFAKEIQ